MLFPIGCIGLIVKMLCVLVCRGIVKNAQDAELPSSGCELCAHSLTVPCSSIHFVQLYTYHMPTIEVL